MEKTHNSVLEMWQKYLQSTGEGVLTTSNNYTSWYFCNNEKAANELVELVLKGKKRATASSLWVYGFEDEPMPQEGDFSVVTDWNGIAKCVIQTLRVNIVPYKDVDENFAATEGEGDGSLNYWRTVHESFFRQECALIGREFTMDMPVVCEEFEIVFK